MRNICSSGKAVEAAVKIDTIAAPSPAGKVLAGDGKGNLNLSEAELKALIFMHRLGAFE